MQALSLHRLGFRSAWMLVAGWISTSFARSIDAASRGDEIASLQALSDAELDQLGITRPEIVEYAFRPPLLKSLTHRD